MSTETNAEAIFDKISKDLYKSNDDLRNSADTLEFIYNMASHAIAFLGDAQVIYSSLNVTDRDLDSQTGTADAVLLTDQLLLHVAYEFNSNTAVSTLRRLKDVTTLKLEAAQNAYRETATVTAESVTITLEFPDGESIPLPLASKPAQINRERLAEVLPALVAAYSA